MIDIENVNLVFATRSGTIDALRDVCLRVEEGEFFALIGPSGCGKTSLLKIVGDLLEPTAGRVLVGGRPPSDARRQHEFSYVFQRPALLPWRTVEQNVMLPAEIIGDSRRPVGEVLGLVGLAGTERLYPRELSGGMQQRVALARALTCRPRILLLDEPFGAVDQLTRERLNSELDRIRRALGVTCLLVTHSIPEAIFLADRVAVMSSSPGTIKEVVQVPASTLRSPGGSTDPKIQELTLWLRGTLE